MSSTETANRLKIWLLKGPKQRALRERLKKIPDTWVTVQVNNATKKVRSQQTILEACELDFKKKVPFNCRAGICGACEAKVAVGPEGSYKMTRICYTPVQEGTRVLTLDHIMQSFRQGTADE